MRADRLVPLSIEWRRLTSARPAPSPTPKSLVLAVFVLGGWLFAATSPATDAANEPTLLDDSTAFSNLFVERREGGRVHDVVDFDGGTWVAQGTVVGRMVESEAERLVLDPVIAFDDALPRHMAVVGGALVVVADVPGRDAVRAHSRVTLWQPEDVAGGMPAGVLELGFVVRFAEPYLDRLVAVGVSVGEDPFDVEGRLAIVDASDLLAPRVAAEIPIEAPEDAAIEGDHLHVAVLRDAAGETRSAHLLSFDVRGEVPALLREEGLADAAYEVRIAAEHGSVMAWWDPIDSDGPWLSLIDVSRIDQAPAPVVFEQVYPFDEVIALALQDGRAWVVVRDGIVLGFDPTRSVRQQWPDQMYAAACNEGNGGVAYGNALWILRDVLLWGCDGLREVSIGDQRLPIDRATRQHVHSTWLVASDSAHVCALDDLGTPFCITQPNGTLRRLGAIVDGVRSSGRNATLAVSGSSLFAAWRGTSPSTAAVFSPVEGAEGRALGHIDGLPSSLSMAASGSTGYLLVDASTDWGVFAIDARDPASPALAGFASLLGVAQCSEIVADGNRVVGLGGDLITVLDTSEPLQPRLAGTVSLGAIGIDVAVRGQLAFAVVREDAASVEPTSGALVAIDLTDSDQPREAWRLPLNGTEAVAADGNHVYVAADGQLRAFVVHGTAAPVEVASAPLPGYPFDLAADVGWVSVALGDGGLWVMRLGGARRAGAFLPVGYAGGAQ